MLYAIIATAALAAILMPEKGWRFIVNLFLRMSK